MVDPRAYFPLARALAEDGHPVAVVELPFRLAPSEDAEGEVMERVEMARRSLDETIPWVLAGHSRGAAISTRLVARHPSEFQGLALIGTTHPRVDLSSLAIPVLKIGGTADCIASRKKSEASAERLPPQTEWLWIEGANHAQFGWYGFQLGDCRPSISREDQQIQTRASLLRFLEEVRTAHSHTDPLGGGTRGVRRRVAGERGNASSIPQPQLNRCHLRLETVLVERREPLSMDVGADGEVVEDIGEREGDLRPIFDDGPRRGYVE